MRRLFVTAVTMLVLAGAAHALDITGNWDTNEGPATTTKLKDGSYTVTFQRIPGKVTGTLAVEDGDDTFTGDWVRQVRRSEPCTWGIFCSSRWARWLALAG